MNDSLPPDVSAGPTKASASPAPVSTNTEAVTPAFKAELERAFLLCTEKLRPERVKILSDMFDRFQSDPLAVVTRTFDNYTRMVEDPYLQYTVPVKDIASTGLMTGIVIAAALQHSPEFRERILKFAQSHLPDTNKIMTFDEVRRRKGLGNTNQGVF